MTKTKNATTTASPTHPLRRAPRCFVVQEPMKMEAGVLRPRINLNHLLPYGKIEFLFNWSDVDTPMWNDVPAILDRLYERLEDFSDDDFLVPLGNPAFIGMATLVASEVNDGKVRMLDWMREDRRYREIAIDLGD